MGLKENLKNKRLELKLTLDDVSKKVGIGRSTLHRYESGIISNIPFDKLEKIAEVLNTTPDKLLGWNGITKKDVNTFDLDRFFESLGFFYKPANNSDKYLLLNKDITHSQKVVLSYEELENIKYDVLSYLVFKVSEIEKKQKNS